MSGHERHHLAGDLQGGDVGVEVQPVHAAGQVQTDMTLEHLVDVGHACHGLRVSARGRLCRPDGPRGGNGHARGWPGGGPDPLPLSIGHRSSLAGRSTSLVHDGSCRRWASLAMKGTREPTRNPYGQSRPNMARSCGMRTGPTGRAMRTLASPALNPTTTESVRMRRDTCRMSCRAPPQGTNPCPGTARPLSS